MKAPLFGLLMAAGSYWIPFAAIEPMARILVPAIALLATGIFPCMTLAVGAMKGDHRSPAQVDELYEELRLVMKILVATFVLAAATVATIVALTGTIAAISVEWGPWVQRGLMGLIALMLSLLAGRVIAIARAFFAILDINRKHALLVARAKVQSERDKALEGVRKHRFPADDTTPRPLEPA
jgi:hypothetical protein